MQVSTNHQNIGINPVYTIQPGWTNSHCSFNRLSYQVVQPVWQPDRVYKHLPGCQTGLTTGLTTGCIV